MSWYKKGIQEALDDLEASSSTGLSKQEVESRLEKYGPNKLEEEKKKSFVVSIRSW